MDRVAYCVFCDDIRQEIGNKTSLIGIYQRDIILNGELPLTIPKLCVSLSIRTGADKPLESLVVRTTFGKETLVDIEVPPNELREGQEIAKKLDEDDDSSSPLIINMMLIASPLNVSEAGKIVVTAIADGETLVAGKLRVRVVNPNDNQPPKVS